MKRFFRQMADLLQNQESFVVATIFDKTGSAPRTAGTKMVIRQNGSIVGTIGGGRLEGEAIRLAGEVLLSGQSVIQSFNLTGEDVAGMDMICGGQGEILLDFIDAGDESNHEIYQKAAEILGQRGKAWLITALGSNNRQSDCCPIRQQCLVKQDGTMIGRFESHPEFLAKLIAGPAKISIHAEVFDNQRFLVEPIRPAGTVYIFGAGHVSQKIAPLCETVGFRTVVLDDRSEFANRERFPEAAEIILLESFQSLPELAVDEDSYLVIVTRGHLHDKTILEWSLRTPAGYIGMIGSRRKRDKVYAALAEQGYGQRDFDRVYSPIGTNIGAETPEELAVSIVGELIKVRAERENEQRQ
ncbi:MAG: XdhC family protein [Negativicutes bacterium]|nr:XdhC family protein [Negativicutes bacterium]